MIANCLFAFELSDTDHNLHYNLILILLCLNYTSIYFSAWCCRLRCI